MAAPDRLERLLAQNAVTGIDFVYVHPDQTTLDVYFLLAPSTLTQPLAADLAAGQITITSGKGAGGEGEDDGDGGVRTVPVDSISWTTVGPREVLRLTTPFPGGFSLYRLSVDDPRLDPYWRSVSFSFKAGCPADLDCEPPEHLCPPEEAVDFPVDYRARDFGSFRRALLDFASQRYPDYKDRLEADFGIMMTEVLAALGDELAYYQDRIAREAWLATATQRRSLRRHARLVDYPAHDGLAASAWLDITVVAGGSDALPAGADVWAESDDGRKIPYEIGRGLAEVLAGTTYAVDAVRNEIRPHIWDEDETCLSAGATELHVKGHWKADLPFDDTPPGKAPGRWVLLTTNPTSADRPARRLVVRLIEVEEGTDPLLVDAEFGSAITRLVWEPEQALPFELDLEALRVRGNLVPATAGETFEARFVVGMDPSNPALGLPGDEQEFLIRAVERTGPEGSDAYLFSLPGSDEAPLARLGEDPRTAVPEVQLIEESWDGGAWVSVRSWEWRRSLLGADSSQEYDHHFTLDDGTWTRVVGYRRPGSPDADATGEVVHRDYARGEGETIRFGDGEFGLVPAAGTVFRVVWRLGNGRATNVAAEALSGFDPAELPAVEALTNPVPAVGGMDAETAEEIRGLAPEAFRAETYRAVRPEDYAEAAERLAWVERAGARMRWTGSWLTTFVTPDPRGAVSISPDQRRDLARQLDRFRQAGREAHPAEPRYADLDVEVHVCVEATSYKSEVEEMVREQLLGRSDLGEIGFFSPDHFTFGTALYRSRLEAAVQEVPGVRAVGPIRVRRRGHFDWRPLTGPYFPIRDQEVIRVENDPEHPDRGSLTLVMEGGA